jgi:hypothetical protein
MTNNTTRQRSALVLIIALSMLTVGAVVAKLRKTPEPTALAAANGKSLRERAQTAPGNHFKGYLAVKTNTKYQDVNQLSVQSSDVIIGDVVSNRCDFTTDEKSIATNYVVSVAKVFKGGLKSGDKIVVTRPGGRVQLEDGSYAEIQPLFAGKLMMNKRHYVLFLTNKGDSYTSVGGPQGMFRIKGDDVEPADGWKNHPVVQKYSTMKREAFLAEVRDATGAK